MSARAEGLERRLAAVWFADVVDYTRLSAEDEEAALGLVADFQEAAREVVARGGGRIVKFVGDAALAEFASTSAAVAAALDLQPALDSRRDAAGRARRTVRAGVHVGEVAGAPDGDVYGDGVNLASRIHGEAEPGAVVISEEVARHLRARRELVIEPLGARALKGLAEPVHLFAVRRGGERRAPAKREAEPGSIAVLPFANLSPDPENEYFSDGVTEEILTALTRLEGLKVISRTSAMRYKGTTKPLREIGRELGVAAVLEGSVRRAGDRVRITAQLIDAGADRHLWADRYDRHLEDIFAIQTDVAERIVEALRGKLTPREQARLVSERTSPQAYQEYLRGLWFLNRRTPDDLSRAVEHFEKSIAADPGYASAHAGIASACALQLHWGAAAGRLAPERVHTEAERARELDPACGEACAARAMVRIYEREWAVAEHDFRCGLECNPGDATARQWYAHLLACLGRFEEALAEIGRALELDPLSLAILTEAGNIRYLARQYDEALAFYRQALDLDPRFPPARYKLFEAYLPLGRFAEAIDEAERLELIDSELAARCRSAGVPEGPRLMLEHILEHVSLNLLPRFYRTLALGILGRRDEAFDQLHRALEERDWYLVRMAVSPQMDPLRADPRFRDILERAGLDHVPLPPREAWRADPLDRARRESETGADGGLS